MITPELTTYIEQQLAGGKTKAEIKAGLQLNGNWLGSDIDEAFDAIGSISHKISKKKITKIPALILIIVLILALGGYIAVKFTPMLSFIQSIVHKRTPPPTAPAADIEIY